MTILVLEWEYCIWKDNLDIEVRPGSQFSIRIHLIKIGISIMEVRLPEFDLISTMEILVLLRWHHLYLTVYLHVVGTPGSHLL